MVVQKIKKIYSNIHTTSNKYFLQNQIKGKKSFQILFKRWLDGLGGLNFRCNAAAQAVMSSNGLGI